MNNPQHLPHGAHGQVVYHGPGGHPGMGHQYPRPGMDPALKSALILLVPMSILRLLVIFWLDLHWFGILLISIFYIFAGVLAAVFFYRNAHNIVLHHGVNPAREKSIAAAMLLCLGSWLVFVLVVAISDQLVITDGPNLIWMGPLEFLVAMLFGILGARLHGVPHQHH